MTASMESMESPISITRRETAGQPPLTAELHRLYDGMERGLLVPLWTEIGDLMPVSPVSAARPHRWSWTALMAMARQAGRLVPVGRGGERRALALANPGLGGRPFATPTLWAAVQYLNAGEHAPVHRHTQNAFRFVVEGEGVWTVVNGDPVAMRRGDFLPQAGWNWHGHLNLSEAPMAWIDGLDIPFSYQIESTFFEYGPDSVDAQETPDRSRSERLWGHPGLQPVTQVAPTASSPLLAYRWEVTDRALDEQLRLEDEGHPVTLAPGHAAVRYVDPSTGGDVLSTVRAEFHRLRPDTATPARRAVGSSVYQVFEGTASVTVGDARWDVERGDLFVVPSWQALTVTTGEGVDLFTYSDAPIFERLGRFRSETAGGAER
ncbi:cupin domain-containing protein [Actinomadura graeca]|uniref:Cupin domain-containing protein n=1 Tax=Actinomadura graeca TaxID=2750812 RepID=A0ABX8R351_9ACTN|nr:cupin domain-containing protein [Actinomadura graeca]QXJ23438.1 cupin domain-containing protein [Actinomadura graeca]